jgi:hypothetical protein
MGPTAISALHVADTGTPVLPLPAEPLDDHSPAEDAPPAARLQLTVDRSGQRGMLDGAWWPRSRDLHEQLPSLIAEIRPQGGQISRVSYHPDTWEPAPRTVTADGGTVKLGWFRSMDPHLLTLTGGYRAGRLDLLVAPPESLAARPTRSWRQRTNPTIESAPRLYCWQQPTRIPATSTTCRCARRAPCLPVARLKSRLTSRVERQAGGGETAPTRLRIQRNTDIRWHR